MNLRIPSSKELAVITTLLQSKSESLYFADNLNHLLVKELNDGGMGSLLLVPKGLENTNRYFGKQLALGEFADSDGVSVTVVINLDSNGQLFELELWKVNFARLLAWPDPPNIRILE